MFTRIVIHSVLLLARRFDCLWEIYQSKELYFCPSQGNRTIHSFVAPQSQRIDEIWCQLGGLLCQLMVQILECWFLQLFVKSESELDH